MEVGTRGGYAGDWLHTAGRRRSSQTGWTQREIHKKDPQARSLL